MFFSKMFKNGNRVLAKRIKAKDGGDFYIYDVLRGRALSLPKAFKNKFDKDDFIEADNNVEWWCENLIRDLELGGFVIKELKGSVDLNGNFTGFVLKAISRTFKIDIDLTNKFVALQHSNYNYDMQSIARDYNDILPFAYYEYVDIDAFFEYCEVLPDFSDLEFKVPSAKCNLRLYDLLEFSKFEMPNGEDLLASEAFWDDLSAQWYDFVIDCREFVKSIGLDGKIQVYSRKGKDIMVTPNFYLGDVENNLIMDCSVEQKDLDKVAREISNIAKAYVESLVEFYKEQALE